MQCCCTTEIEVGTNLKLVLGYGIHQSILLLGVVKNLLLSYTRFSLPSKCSSNLEIREAYSMLLTYHATMRSKVVSSNVYLLTQTLSLQFWVQEKEYSD